MAVFDKTESLCLWCWSKKECRKKSWHQPAEVDFCWKKLTSAGWTRLLQKRKPAGSDFKLGSFLMIFKDFLNNFLYENLHFLCENLNFLHHFENLNVLRGCENLIFSLWKILMIFSMTFLMIHKISYPGSSVPGHRLRNHLNDPASVFLSTHWWSQHPACQRCFYRPLRNCHPSPS